MFLRKHKFLIASVVYFSVLASTSVLAQGTDAASAPQAPVKSPVWEKIASMYLPSIAHLKQPLQTNVDQQQVQDGQQKKKDAKAVVADLEKKKIDDYDVHALALSILAANNQTTESSLTPFIDENAYKCLTLFCGKSKKDNVDRSIFSTLDRTTTVLGRMQLLKMFYENEVDVRVLRNRQKTIKTFLDNPALMKEIEQLLQKYKSAENEFFGLWQESDESTKKLLDMPYFSSRFLNFLNSPLFLELDSWSTRVGKPALMLVLPSLIAAAMFVGGCGLVGLMGQGIKDLMAIQTQEDKERFTKNIFPAFAKLVSPQFLKESVVDCVDIGKGKFFGDFFLGSQFIEFYITNNDFKIPDCFIDPEKETSDTSLNMTNILKDECKKRGLVANMFRGYQPDAIQKLSLARFAGDIIKNFFEKLPKENKTEKINNLLFLHKLGQGFFQGISLVGLVTIVLVVALMTYLTAAPAFRNASLMSGITNLIHKKMISLATLVSARNDLAALVNNNKVLLKSLPAVSTTVSDRVRNLEESLLQNTFTGQPQFFTRKGNVLFAFRESQQLKDELISHPDAVLMANLDAHLALAKLYKEGGWCFPEYIENSDEPFISFENAWPVFVGREKAVVNSGKLGGPGGAKGVMITGPNAGGKTTGVKQMTYLAILAKLGMVPAEKCSLTPFAYVGTFLNTEDNEGTESSYQAEMNQAKKLFAYADALRKESAKQGKKLFGLILGDEIFTKTDPKVGCAAAYGMLRRFVEEFPDVLVFCTTHYPELTKLAADTNGRYTNWMVDVKEENGKFIPLYKLQEGISTKNIALQMLGQGFDEGVAAYGAQFLANQH